MFGPVEPDTQLKSRQATQGAGFVLQLAMLQLRQAALSLDSPDRAAAQVLSGFGDPNENDQDKDTSTEAKDEDDEDTSVDDTTGTPHKGDRQGVVKIVWTAEEDQQLLQVTLPGT